MHALNLSKMFALRQAVMSSQVKTTYNLKRKRIKQEQYFGNTCNKFDSSTQFKKI